MEQVMCGARPQPQAQLDSKVPAYLFRPFCSYLPPFVSLGVIRHVQVRRYCDQLGIENEMDLASMWDYVSQLRIHLIKEGYSDEELLPLFTGTAVKNVVIRYRRLPGGG